ncbi:hypothetical protein BV898_03352 [Hypsibius exemplaris]|uniref:KASH domain-containing protein n=1 Tax=Hypsibius exemplaris TaxID=2072580 RepID=A0A1W0X5U8_HYPEX|nr:hypothetical protein BV898_03352 [Hypsibius exemplaris]
MLPQPELQKHQQPTDHPSDNSIDLEEELSRYGRVVKRLERYLHLSALHSTCSNLSPNNALQELQKVQSAIEKLVNSLSDAKRRLINGHATDVLPPPHDGDSDSQHHSQLHHLLANLERRLKQCWLKSLEKRLFLEALLRAKSTDSPCNQRHHEEEVSCIPHQPTQKCRRLTRNHSIHEAGDLISATTSLSGRRNLAAPKGAAYGRVDESTPKFAGIQQRNRTMNARLNFFSPELEELFSSNDNSDRNNQQEPLLRPESPSTDDYEPDDKWEDDHDGVFFNAIHSEASLLGKCFDPAHHNLNRSTPPKKSPLKAQLGVKARSVPRFFNKQTGRRFHRHLTRPGTGGAHKNVANRSKSDLDPLMYWEDNQAFYSSDAYSETSLEETVVRKLTDFGDDYYSNWLPAAPSFPFPAPPTKGFHHDGQRQQQAEPLLNCNGNDHAITFNSSSDIIMRELSHHEGGKGKGLGMCSFDSSSRLETSSSSAFEDLILQCKVLESKARRATEEVGEEESHNYRNDLPKLTSSDEPNILPPFSQRITRLEAQWKEHSAVLKKLSAAVRQVTDAHNVVCNRCVTSLAVLMDDFACLLSQLQDVTPAMRERIDRASSQCCLQLIARPPLLPPHPANNANEPHPPEIRSKECLPDLVRQQHGTNGSLFNGGGDFKGKEGPRGIGCAEVKQSSAFKVKLTSERITGGEPSQDSCTLGSASDYSPIGGGTYVVAVADRPKGTVTHHGYRKWASTGSFSGFGGQLRMFVLIFSLIAFTLLVLALNCSAPSCCTYSSRYNYYSSYGLWSVVEALVVPSDLHVPPDRPF